MEVQQANMDHYTPTEIRVAQENPHFNRDDVKAVAAVRRALILQGVDESPTEPSTSQSNEAELKKALLALLRYIEADLENNSPQWKPEDIPQYVNAKALLGHSQETVQVASEISGVFKPKYKQYASRKGQSFTLLGVVDPTTYDVHETGLMYRIKFADGEVIEAWPEEVETALQLGDADKHSEEVIVNLADGCTLRSGVYDPHAEGALTSGEYVRLCDQSGEEVLYWDKDEWATDPALVMGAIINSAAGLRVKPCLENDDSPSQSL